MNVVFSFAFDAKKGYAQLIDTMESVGFIFTPNILFASADNEIPVTPNGRINLIIKATRTCKQELQRYIMDSKNYESSVLIDFKKNIIYTTSVPYFNGDDIEDDINFDSISGENEKKKRKLCIDIVYEIFNIVINKNEYKRYNNLSGLLFKQSNFLDKNWISGIERCIADRFNYINSGESIVSLENPQNPYEVYYFLKKKYDSIVAKEQSRNLNENEYGDFLNEINNYEQVCSQLVRFYLIKGLVYDLKLKNFDKTIECYEKAASVAVYDSSCFYICGLVLYKYKKFHLKDNILFLFNRALQNNPLCYKSLYKLACYYSVHLKDVFNAIKAYNSILVILKKSYDNGVLDDEELDYYYKALYKLMLSFEEIGNYERALAYAEYLLPLDREIRNRNSDLSGRLRRLTNGPILAKIEFYNEQVNNG